MIKDSLARLIGLFLRLKGRYFAKESPLNMVKHLASTKKVLIYMPSKIEEFGAALKSLEKLRGKRPHWQITVITKLEMVSLIDSSLRVDILPYSNEDINLFGLPKWSIKKHFKDSAYDLALDFKFKFDLLSIKLFQLSGAPLKVCFESSDKFHFYNFGIRVNPIASLANKYNVMVKYITAIADALIQPTSQQLQ